MVAAEKVVQGAVVFVCPRVRATGDRAVQLVVAVGHSRHLFKGFPRDLEEAPALEGRKKQKKASKKKNNTNTMYINRTDKNEQKRRETQRTTKREK